jgi:hypothetical protein
MAQQARACHICPPPGKISMNETQLADSTQAAAKGICESLLNDEGQPTLHGLVTVLSDLQVRLCALELAVSAIQAYLQLRSLIDAKNQDQPPWSVQ